MCDTFVVLPSVSADGSMIFGKNSDREPSEVQLLEYYPECRHDLSDTVKCTYSIKVTNTTLSGSGDVDFSLDVFGHVLPSAPVELPPEF